MQSKFAIRKPPRKRPWICKASPPALPAPAYPPSLYATLYLAYDGPPYPPTLFNQTLLLLPLAPAGPYNGTYSQGGNFLSLQFIWTVGDDLARADANWSISGYLAVATYPTLPVQQWPKLSYAAFDFLNPKPPYRTRLLITN